jgi:hypothetical protein
MYRIYWGMSLHFLKLSFRVWPPGFSAHKSTQHANYCMAKGSASQATATYGSSLR